MRCRSPHHQDRSRLSEIWDVKLSSTTLRWQAFRAETYRPGAREAMRREIAGHTLRVVPGRRGGVGVIPCA